MAEATLAPPIEQATPEVSQPVVEQKQPLSQEKAAENDSVIAEVSQQQDAEDALVSAVAHVPDAQTAENIAAMQAIGATVNAPETPVVGAAPVQDHGAPSQATPATTGEAAAVSGTTGALEWKMTHPNEPLPQQEPPVGLLNQRIQQAEQGQQAVDTASPAPGTSGAKLELDEYGQIITLPSSDHIEDHPLAARGITEGSSLDPHAQALRESALPSAGTASSPEKQNVQPISPEDQQLLGDLERRVNQKVLEVTDKPDLQPGQVNQASADVYDRFVQEHPDAAARLAREDMDLRDAVARYESARPKATSSPTEVAETVVDGVNTSGHPGEGLEMLPPVKDSDAAHSEEPPILGYAKDGSANYGNGVIGPSLEQQQRWGPTSASGESLDKPTTDTGAQQTPPEVVHQEMQGLDSGDLGKDEASGLDSGDIAPDPIKVPEKTDKPKRTRIGRNKEKTPQDPESNKTPADEAEYTNGQKAYKEIAIDLGIPITEQTHIDELIPQLQEKGWNFEGDYLQPTVRYVQEAIDQAKMLHQEEKEPQAARDGQEPGRVYESPYDDPDIRTLEEEITRRTNLDSAVTKVRDTGEGDYSDTWYRVNGRIARQQVDIFIDQHPDKAKAYAEKYGPIKAALEARERVQQQQEQRKGLVTGKSGGEQKLNEDIAATNTEVKASAESLETNDTETANGTGQIASEKNNGVDQQTTTEQPNAPQPENETVAALRELVTQLQTENGELRAELGEIKELFAQFKNQMKEQMEALQKAEDIEDQKERRKKRKELFGTIAAILAGVVLTQAAEVTGIKT